MPELPEVEIIVRGLRPRLSGQCVSQVELIWPGVVAVPSPSQFERDLLGLQVVTVTRRGKFIIVELSPAKFLLAHLRMTGCLLFNDEPCAATMRTESDDRHVRAVIHFASGATLRFRDMRKFGRLYLVDDPDQVVQGLGPEPLADLNPQILAQMMHRRRGRIKSILQDQRFLAGLGNIYIDESLWEARIHPLRPAHTLSSVEIEHLYRAIHRVLGNAIANKGTTLRDYRDAGGEPGRNQDALAVYQRHGQACHRCGHTIERLKVGGRSTHFCPVCQVLPVH